MSDGEDLYRLQGAGLKSPTGIYLRDLDWIIPSAGVTLILGPAGTGKSSLMATLAGAPPKEVTALGTWRYRGSDLFAGGRGRPDGVFWLPQHPAGARAVRREADPPAWRTAFESGASTLLMDEPTVGRGAEEVAELGAALRAHGARGAAVIVTHDLAFARAVADSVGFVCAGELRAKSDARSFFEGPQTDLVARFLKQGNCWPAVSQPPLPSHFRWVLPDSLAGMGRPGLIGDEDEDLFAIASAGITHLVSLTEEPVSPAKLRAFGLVGRSFPIPDMGIPPVATTARLCRDIERVLGDGGRVAVHCHAGLGRTGTILAATLVWLGRSPEAAIEEIRARVSRYIQTSVQLEFVHRFAEGAGTGKVSGSPDH